MRPIGRVLTEVTDPATGEVFNIHEVGLKKYTLRRYLKLIGLNFDEAKGLIDNLSNMVNVDKCDSDLLLYIADLLDWDLNLDLPIVAQRREIKNAVAVYKRKGTKTGIQTGVAAIIGADPIVEEMRYRILEIYRADRIVADTEDPFRWIQKGLPGDTNHYIPCLGTGCMYNWNSYAIFIMLPLNEPLTRIKTQKIDRLMLLYNPLNTDDFIVLVDEVQDEIFDFDIDVVEYYEDEVEDSEVEIFLNPNTLITNDINHETNSVNSVIYMPWAFEEWWDEIIGS